MPKALCKLSRGHTRHTHTPFGLDSGAVDRLLKNEEVRAALSRPHEIIRDYDLPYIAGYSDDGSKIYIDRHLPDELTIQLDGKKVSFDPTPYLCLHESFEKALIDVCGYPYERAHNAALGYERRFVLQTLGPGMWGPYDKIWQKWAKHDEHEKLSKLPPDLDMLPYVSPPVDHKLLTHMEKIMGYKKAIKEEANYGPERGTPQQHCGPDEGWKKGYCKSYKEENRCLKVAGLIKERGSCDLYEKAK